eukprot:IDg3419t1
MPSQSDTAARTAPRPALASASNTSTFAGSERARVASRVTTRICGASLRASNARTTARPIKPVPPSRATRLILAIVGKVWLSIVNFLRKKEYNYWGGVMLHPYVIPRLLFATDVLTTGIPPNEANQLHNRPCPRQKVVVLYSRRPGNNRRSACYSEAESTAGCRVCEGDAGQGSRGLIGLRDVRRRI